MTERFQNKYRIPSARHPYWDYRNNGAYFITICTKGRLHYFGKIENGIMRLNDMGKMAERYWIEIPNHFPMVELENFVIMPNHVHGILIINNPVFVVEALQCNTSTMEPKPTEIENIQALQCNASTAETDIEKNEQMSKISPKQGSVSTIIRSYKSVVTKNIRLNIHADFEWQSRFHDHIIRNNQSLERIQNYILNNPQNWDNDKFYNLQSD